MGLFARVFLAVEMAVAMGLTAQLRDNHREQPSALTLAVSPVSSPCGTGLCVAVLEPRITSIK